MDLQSLLFIPIMIIFGIIIVCFLYAIFSQNSITTLIYFMFFIILLIPFYYLLIKLHQATSNLFFINVFLLFTYIVFSVIFIMYVLIMIYQFVLNP